MKYLALENTRLDGRYDLEALIGRGSYAEIYLARDSVASPDSLHSRVVIKALNVFLQNDLDRDLERTLVENFQNEAVALDRVRHQNIISRVGHGTARDLRGTVFHYLALEYLSGGDLAKICREEGLTLAKTLDYSEQICAGLAFAHQNGIIHRDMKPQNLLLTSDRETVKIADFGVARISQNDSPITRVGTNVYAPPEHSPMLAGQTGLLVSPKLTPAADIYSLAKTIYVMITRESPRSFANHPITELPDTVRHQIWARELAAILEKATQSDSRRRHQNVDELWEDLSKLRRFTSQETIAGEIDVSLSALYAIPQPQTSNGGTAFKPKPTDFDSDSLISGFPEAFSDLPAVIEIAPDSAVHITQQENGNLNGEIRYPPEPAGGLRKRRFLRKFAAFSVLLVLFAGGLFATQYYIRSQNIFPAILNNYEVQKGVSTTDVNLRSDPTSIEDNRIGIVSKNSRLKILNERDNWYEVEILEHGRPPLSDRSPARGWVFGKFVKIEAN